MSQQAAQSDKRQFSRFANDSSIILNKAEQQWESSLLDISLKGVLITKPENWNDDNDGDFKLSIKLDGSDFEINMDVQFAHAENDHIGFHCEKIDLDSVTNLKRLVELNLTDEKLLQREISNMISA
jgi:hypothetical protein